MASSIALQSLVPGLEFTALPGGAAGLGAGRQVYILKHNAPNTTVPNQIQVYGDAALTLPLSQPLTTLGASTAQPGVVPGFIAAEQEIDFYDVLSGERTQAEALAVPDVVTDVRGVASGDLLVFNGTSFVRLPKGSAGQQLHTRSDGSVAWVTPGVVTLLDWGLHADGVVTVVTVGASANTFTAPTGTFTAGQMLCINGVGAGGVPLITTITSVTPGSPNDTILMGATTTFAATNARTYAATDDAAIIQNAINTFAPTGATLVLPSGVIGLSTTVDFNIKGPNLYTALLALHGAGGSGAGTPPDTLATRLLNFGSDEAILSTSTATFGLGFRGFAVQNLQDPAAANVTTMYLTNWGAYGYVDDVSCYGTGNNNDQFTGTIVPGTPDTITGVTTFAPSGVSNVKQGDYVYVTATVSGNPTLVVGTTITAINPVAQTITLSSSGTAMSGTAKLTSSTQTPGNGFCLDNPGDGHQVIDRLNAFDYTNCPASLTPSFLAGEGIRFGAQIYSTPGITGNYTAGSKTITGISSFANWLPGAVVTGPATTVNGTGQTISTTPSTLTVASTTGFPSGGGTLTVAGITGIVTYTGTSPTTFTGCTIFSGSQTATNGGSVTPTVTFQVGTYVARVKRAAGTATLNVPCIGSGTATGATLTMAATGGNSGNFSSRACLVQSCGIGLHLYGYFGSGGQMDGCTFDAYKTYACSTGLLAEYDWENCTISAPHIEGSYTGIHLAGCTRVQINTPLLSKSSGTVGDGSCAIVMDAGTDIYGAYGNRIDLAYFEGNGWDHWVKFAGAGLAAASNNRVNGGGATAEGTYVALSSKVVRLAGNTWVDQAYDGWTAIGAFQTNFSATDATRPPAYRIDADGDIRLRGTITSSAAVAAGTSICGLPFDLGFNGSGSVFIPCRATNSPTQDFNQLQIIPTGTITTTVNGTGQTISTSPSTLTVASTTGLTTVGQVTVAGVVGVVSYTGLTGTTLTGCTIPNGSYTATNGGNVMSGPIVKLAYATSASGNIWLTGAFSIING